MQELWNSQDRKRFFFIAVRKDISKSDFDIEELMKKYIVSEITFMEAMSDLPRVKAKEYPEDASIEYDQKPHNEYQKVMRCGS